MIKQIAWTAFCTLWGLVCGVVLTIALMPHVIQESKPVDENWLPQCSETVTDECYWDADILPGHNGLKNGSVVISGDSVLLPPCVEEDSTHCYWDAETMGNNTGNDLVNLP